MKGLTPSLLALLVLSASALAAEDTHQVGQIAHGEYLARAGDCAACHTAPGGMAFAGGLKMTTPVGAIYSTNITPDKPPGSVPTIYRSLPTPCVKALGAMALGSTRPCPIPLSPKSMMRIYAICISTSPNG